MDIKDQLILLLAETRQQIINTNTQQEKIKLLLTQFSLEERISRIES